MRLLIAIGLLGLAGCIKTEDGCDADKRSVTGSAVLTPSAGQAYLSTPAAAKDCHAVFVAYLAYTGDDRFDDTLPRPSVDVSANAIGTGGEQPGLLGIFNDWTVVQDETGELGWQAELSAGAKNVDAPAVNYGMAAVMQPDETREVTYEASIEYLLPPAEETARIAVCRR